MLFKLEDSCLFLQFLDMIVIHLKIFPLPRLTLVGIPHSFLLQNPHRIFHCDLAASSLVPGFPLLYCLTERLPIGQLCVQCWETQHIVSSPYLQITHPHRFNAPPTENIQGGRKIPENSRKQNLNSLCT